MPLPRHQVLIQIVAAVPSRLSLYTFWWHKPVQRVRGRSLDVLDVLIDHDEVVGVVIDHRQPRSVAAADHRDADAECSTRCRIDVELADELAASGQFDDFARVVRIGIDRVAVAGDQVAVRRKLPAPLVHVAVRPWQ